MTRKLQRVLAVVAGAAVAGCIIAASHAAKADNMMDRVRERSVGPSVIELYSQRRDGAISKFGPFVVPGSCKTWFPALRSWAGFEQRFPDSRRAWAKCDRKRSA